MRRCTGITRSYVLENDHVAEERLSGGSTGTLRYYHGAGVDDWLGRQEVSGASTYFIADHLGSVVRHTDSAGQPALTRTYDAWGNLDATSAAVSGPAYTGREWDAESSLHYYRARYYDPVIARFVNEDPIGFVAGTNRYRYVENTPVVAVDPLGLLNLKNLDCVMDAQRAFEECQTRANRAWPKFQELCRVRCTHPTFIDSDCEKGCLKGFWDLFLSMHEQCTLDLEARLRNCALDPDMIRPVLPPPSCRV